MAGLSTIIEDNKFTPADVPELESKLFFEGDRSRRHLVRFTVLLFLSAVIAVQGVIEDSTATVIGAMIIAPLMNPILATTAALVMGNGPRAWRSFLLVVSGTLGVIVLAAMFGTVAVHIVDFSTNSQITGRVTPRLLDLVVALAAGTAGAFAMSRDDVADSLPGVAVSIALVPPLCVVGISLSAGEWDHTWGALLLFLTNLLSILLAGGAIFALLGLGKATTEGTRQLDKMRITNIANNWARQYATDSVVRSVLASGSRAKILVTGSEQPSTVEDLGAQIKSEVEWVAEVDLRFVPSRDYLYR
jgi:uncharacterized hydrophobic protein (TIGR00271 family)